MTARVPAQHRGRMLVITCALAACYHEPASTPASTPPANQAVRAAPSYATTIADPLGFLPLDAELVMSLDAGIVRASALWQRYAPPLLAKVSTGLSVFQQRCKIDPIASITRVTMGLRDLGNPHPSGVLVVQGIEAAKFMACARTGVGPGSRVELVGDTLVMRATATEQGMVARFVGARTCVAVVGNAVDEHSLEPVLAAGSPLRGSPAFAAMFAKVDTHQALWLVMNGNSKVFDKMVAMGVRPKALWASFALTDGVAMNMHIQLDSAQEAQQLAGVAQAQIGMVKAMVDDISLTAEDVDLVLSVAIGDAKLQALLGLFGASAVGP